ncbi:hypothetical protein EDC01DRAFT_677690 [Geopyxis carbonaria]|nr:hypothetical protein EDC01DRAFT_677690 [Geopyxis carbonaria]
MIFALPSGLLQASVAARKTISWISVFGISTRVGEWGRQVKTALLCGVLYISHAGLSQFSSLFVVSLQRHYCIKKILGIPLYFLE